VDCFRRSYQDEGWRFLTRGLTSTMIRSFPTNAATFATVTWVMRVAGTVETPAVADHLSASEFLEEMRKGPLVMPNASPAATFVALNVRRREQDMVSVNGEEGDEAARRLVASAGSTILGTLGRLREVESAFL
jgi:Mitochondrial carrier protein